MPLEDVCTVETLFGRAARAWAETAHHSALVVSQGVAVLVILPGKALGMILACGNWALLRALILVSEHMCLQVLEVPATSRVWAKALIRLI